MIRVCIDCGGETKEITLKGHAGYAPKGEDIVCSAASMLVYTAAEVLTQLYAAGVIREEPVIQLAAGDCRISFRGPQNGLADALVWFVATGFTMLCDRYPANVQAEIRMDPEQDAPSR